MNIDKAKLSDIAQILNVQKETWLATYPNADYGITTHDVLLRIEGKKGEQRAINKKHLESVVNGVVKDSIIFVAKHRGKVVGYICPNIKNGVCRLGALYVLPGFQNQGIGKLLMNKAIQWHGSNKTIYLKVAKYNTNAIKFYEHSGFRISDKSITDTTAIERGIEQLPLIEMKLKT